MLRTEGRGRFCGVMLHVWNPRGGWWGEGDEKFFVDGEKFPSTFGTGSEDYFGYAWCDPHLFQRPYHCQTMTENNKGHQSVLRWHITDNVPFQKSFEGVHREVLPEREAARSTPARPAGTWPPAASIRIGPCPVPSAHGYYVESAAGGGGFKVSGKPKGNVESQAMEPLRRRASGTTTISSGGPAPSRATSSTWACRSRRPGNYDVSVR